MRHTCNHTGRIIFCFSRATWVKFKIRNIYRQCYFVSSVSNMCTPRKGPALLWIGLTWLWLVLLACLSTLLIWAFTIIMSVTFMGTTPHVLVSQGYKHGGSESEALQLPLSVKSQIAADDASAVTATARLQHLLRPSKCHLLTRSANCWLTACSFNVCIFKHINWHLIAAIVDICCKKINKIDVI